MQACHDGDTELVKILSKVNSLEIDHESKSKVKVFLNGYSCNIQYNYYYYQRRSGLH